MKVLVIPDIHLKPWMFDRAEKIMESGQADFAVQLGDLVDDWGMELAIPLYRKTMARASSFRKKFPKTLWCMGNHDYGYYEPEWGRKETGHSRLMEDVMAKLLEQAQQVGIQQKIIHIVDNVIFSHAGLTKDFVRIRLLDEADEQIDDYVEAMVNCATSEDLWHGDSPLWARPQENYNTVTRKPICETYPIKMWKSEEFFQVVGHTPVRKIVQFDNFLSTDVFSTYSDGSPLGEEKFAIVNTIAKTWEYAEEEK